MGAKAGIKSIRSFIRSPVGVWNIGSSKVPVEKLREQVNHEIGSFLSIQMLNLELLLLPTWLKRGGLDD